jgi:hypothetical protein
MPDGAAVWSLDIGRVTTPIADRQAGVMLSAFTVALDDAGVVAVAPSCRLDHSCESPLGVARSCEGGTAGPGPSKP